MHVSATTQHSSQMAIASDGAFGPGGELGEDAFLKLLVAQLRNQDPLSPLQDKDFMAQMAQFRMLEQLDKLNQTVAYQAGVQSLMQATGLLGKEVTTLSSDQAEPSTGVVSRVGLRDGEVVLTIDGEDAYLSDVIRVES